MKKILSVLCILACMTSMRAADKVDIVPVPAVVSVSDGSYAVAGAVVSVDPKAKASAMDVATGFAASLSKASGVASDVKVSTEGGICFVLDKKLPEEEYVIDVTAKGVRVKASSRSGFFYGVQTLKQMLPISIYGGVSGESDQWTLPCVHIEDRPAFAYRGMHLDCSRHFFSVEEVKKYIDIMSMYKMNRFHWHLTDDQGWRIESKLYPRLTEVGAFRKGTQIGYDRFSSDNIPYGGFYTQQEVKEIIEYASQRCIMIIPEVDLPGHMLAALTAYPELGCNDGPYDLWTRWGVSPQVLNPAKPATMDFLKGICGELADLFPGEYFHIGGDECPKTEWEQNAQCQELIAKLGLVTDKKGTKEQRLQNWVTIQMQEFLAAKGKKVIGWDEILEGDLKPGAVVMSWRGADKGIAAAKKGFDVIMTPSSHLYFDFVQSPRLDKEPLSITTQVHRALPWQKTYAFDPYDKLDEQQKKHILGVQANLWTEYIATPEHLEYMFVPRIFALSEVQWSPAEKRDEARIRQSMESHQIPIASSLGYNYRPLDPVDMSPAPAGKNVMRLLYWNIQNGMWADQGNNYDKFVEWVKTYDPDVCVWCEAASIWKTGTHDKMTNPAEKYLPGGWPELAARYGHKYLFVACFRDNYPQVITSKYPIEEVAHIAGEAPDSVVVHGAGWAKIRYNGHEVNIVPLHTWPQKYSPTVPRDQRPQSAEKFEGDKYRETEIKYICEHTILAADPEGRQNWIMLGDFNSKNRRDIGVYRMKDDGHTFLCQDWIAAHTPYLDVIGLAAGERFVPSTGGASRIDYIYITKPLMPRVKEAYFITDPWTLPAKTAISGFYDPSDHRPACLDLDFSRTISVPDRKSDWAKFYRYQEANDAVHRSNAKVKAVLMGDSITDNWLKFDKEWFEQNHLQGRGISGQVTSQMLVRFQEDVVKLNPTYVAILAGTNDIARNNGEISLEHIMDNIKSMCEIARANNIKVVLCSVLPASRYGWRPELSPAEDIKALNAMICAYAKANKFIYVDYWSLLANEQGGLNPENAADGVHPNLETYKLMEQALMKVLK